MIQIKSKIDLNYYFFFHDKHVLLKENIQKKKVV